MSGSHAHIFTGEHSRFRRWTLFFFARYIELPLLRWGYLLLRGRYRRLGSNRLVRALIGWGVAAPFGYLGDTARPVPYAEVQRMIDGLDGSIAVGPCRCRLSHTGCEHPLETDIVIRTGVEAWTRAFPRDYRPIAKEEAKAIIADCHRQGLWHMVFIHCPVSEESRRENEYVICNCCRCGCVPYILNRELGQRTYPLLRGSTWRGWTRRGVWVTEIVWPPVPLMPGGWSRGGHGRWGCALAAGGAWSRARRGR
jgi:hypothetical protein